MSDLASRQPDGSPVFDTLDVDLVIKVLSNTALSASTCISSSFTVDQVFQAPSLYVSYPFSTSFKEPNYTTPSSFLLPSILQWFLLFVRLFLPHDHGNLLK